MHTYSSKNQGGKGISLADRISGVHRDAKPSLQLVDNRPEAIQMRRMQKLANEGAGKSVIQRAFGIYDQNNPTNLPADLRTFINGAQWGQMIAFGFDQGDTVATLLQVVGRMVGPNTGITIEDSSGTVLGPTQLLVQSESYIARITKNVGVNKNSTDVPPQNPPSGQGGHRGHRRTNAMGQSDWSAMLGY